MGCGSSSSLDAQTPLTVQASLPAVPVQPYQHEPIKPFPQPPSQFQLQEPQKIKSEPFSQSVNGSNVFLPSPVPPTTSKSDLLSKHANSSDSAGSLLDAKNIFPSSNQSISDFTKNELLPPETENQFRKVEIVEESRVHPIGGDSNPPIPPPIPPPISPPTPPPTSPPMSPPIQPPTSPPMSPPIQPPTSPPMSPPIPSNSNISEPLDSSQAPSESIISATSADVEEMVKGQIQMQMEQLQEQRKIAEQQKLNAKMKQQQTLREKLKQRSEMKKKKAAAAAAAPAGTAQETQQAQEEIEAVQETKLRDLTLDPSLTNLSPQPTIPVTKKEALYSEENIELFRDLENFAVNMEKVTSEAVTFANLMDSLLIAQLSDLEKVRILFHWITSQDLNSINFPPNVSEDTPLGFLLAIKQDKKSYASLFVRLCGAATIHAKMITGYLKGVGYYPDYKFQAKGDPFRGSWNAVLIDGQWRLIDTNWGARHVTEENAAASANWQTEYQYEEHYFLTDPDQAINTHFPDERDWQLLSDPYSLEKFEKTSKLWPLFYKLKLEQLSHTEGMINPDEHGYVKIRLRVSAFAQRDAKFKGELRFRHEQQQSAGNLQQYTFHHVDGDTEIFEVFLPAPGQYLFKIFGLSEKFGEKNVYTNICLYQINCSSIKSPPSNTEVTPPFPITSYHYGPSLVHAQNLASPISHQGPIVFCDANGEATVTMKLTTNDSSVVFAQDLFDTNNPSTALSGRTIQSRYITAGGDSEISFRVRTPRNGNYALTLYSNASATNSSTFSPFCYYLVCSKNQPAQQIDALPFPNVPNGKVGSVQPSFGELGLSFISAYPTDQGEWKNGFMKTDSNGECVIAFHHSKPLTILADLSCPTASFGLNDFSSVETIGNYTTVTVRTPPQIGEKAVSVLKVYAAEVNQTQNIPSVFIGFVTSNAQNIQVDPLPQSPTRTWGVAGPTYLKSSINKITFNNSVSAMQSKLSLPDNEASSSWPCRLYNGGDDFEMIVKMSTPIQLKAKLIAYDGINNDTNDRYLLIQRPDAQTATVRVRLARTGLYSLTLYGSSLNDSSGQLSPLTYILIRVTAPSSCTLAFPTAFGIWTSSACILRNPLTEQLQGNGETVIKVFLARFNESGGAWSVTPYSDVMLVVDGTTPVMVANSSSGEYEWKYFPGPGEKQLGILVKPTEDSQSMTYALQFSVA